MTRWLEQRVHNQGLESIDTNSPRELDNKAIIQFYQAIATPK